MKYSRGFAVSSPSNLLPIRIHHPREKSTTQRRLHLCPDSYLHTDNGESRRGTCVPPQRSANEIAG